MKEEIIRLLKKNQNEFISGEDISSALGISRAAVWKYMKAIKEDGYNIESVSRKGYKLISSPDLLTFEEISPYLNTSYIGKQIVYFNSIDSTNNEAKKLASSGCSEGIVIISEEQTMGRGRLGRNWVSPKFKGIWMSIVLRPDIDPMNVAKITQVGAAAVLKAIKEQGINAYIKWPNDIVLNNKKVCGILTEMSGEINNVNYVVMGIGINVNIDKEDFPEEIEEIATSLKIEECKSIERKALVASILNNLEELYKEFIKNEDIKTSIDICRENSILIGKSVRIINRNDEIQAQVLDLSDDGKLIVKYQDGSIHEVISGEVSVRGLYGYV
ncbi:biotin--[acetyl-CoA-carboxylase] ligase [Clostridium sp. HMP27]|uniref:biotin--[acetyl-CoA-carboxylase] ligase n=1 Tax=Clostridium sp. HMP27 TaxID=1487921 RepID=UPI00052DB38D|nr:biotin--[acetyl-CoA-carboxylase] ligase [Clostridium sp. HMP27]KGK87702.1 biotin--acetyl-CoA-carboxylase ligase [Clostridium sp. HMP27]